MKLVRLLLFAWVVTCWPLFSFAWGLLGHRVIGGIADKYLDPVARTEIRKLLGNESIAMASNWADFIKSDRRYDYLGPWHYINLPAGLNRQQFFSYLSRDTATDLHTRLQFLVKELKKKNLEPANRVFYLKLLIHLVGDAHQPLHAAHADDKGGNMVRVSWFSETTNLHRVWDEHLVEFQQLSYSEYVSAINFAAQQDINIWQRAKPEEWLFESYQLAEKIYDDVKPGDRLHFSYNYRYVDIVNRQLLKGGIRLAGLLNNIFQRR